MAKDTAPKVSAEDFEKLRAELMAELEAERAKSAALEAELASKKGPGRKAPEFPADRLVDADTILGKVQRMDRQHVFDALPKLYRAVGIADAAEAVVALAEKVAAQTGKTVEEVVTTYTTPAPRKKKGEEAPAKVQDDTEPATQPE